MAVPWLTEMVGLASVSAQGEEKEGERGETQTEEDQARHSHRGIQRDRDGLELPEDT